VLLPLAAMAQTAPTPVQPPGIDLRPIFEQFVVLLITAIGPILIAWAVAELRRLTAVKQTESLQATAEELFANGLAIARSRFAGVPMTIEVRNQILAEATNYVLTHGLNTMKKLKAVDLIAEKLDARLARQEQAGPPPAPPEA